MQPAVFNDGQLLATTHYHVDACLWKADTFIDGATFLMPSKLPEAGLENYIVDLDDTTGIYHVVLQKVSLRASQALMQSSKPDFSSHFIEFSNGVMTAVPRVDCAAISLECEVQQIAHGEHQWDTSITQPEPVSCQDAHVQSCLAGSSLSTSQETNSHAPAESDSSITGFGRVVGLQAADDHASLCNFSVSIFHIISQNAKASTCIALKESEAAVQAQELVTTTPHVQTSKPYCTSRRSSAGSLDSGIPPSTAPTSPRSSTFSTVPFEKLALANLPEVPIAPGKVNYVVEALALENRQHDYVNMPIDLDSTVLCRLGLNLEVSHRQLAHLVKIQESESPCLRQAPPMPKSGLAMTDGLIYIALEDNGSE